MFESFHCVIRQHCTADDDRYFWNSYDGSKNRLPLCFVRDTEFINENEAVTTIYPGFTGEVKMFQYFSGNVLKFIPNSIFETFLFLEHFYIFNKDQQFAVLKPEYLKGAKRLKVLQITLQKQFKNLEANSFTEAPILQHINLQNNALESIHESAFSGLPKLQGVYLKDNKISSLHPSTFSNLPQLNVIDLLANTCIQKKYESANNIKSTIESEIRGGCSYATVAKTQSSAKTNEELAEMVQRLAATIEELKAKEKKSG